MKALVLAVVTLLAVANGQFFYNPGFYFPRQVAYTPGGFFANRPVPVPTVKTAATRDDTVAVDRTPVVPPAVAPVAAPFAFPSNLIQTYHAQDDAGAYEFGYFGGPSSKHEYRDQFGVIRGSYNYIDAEGKVQTRNYVADNTGFRAVDSNAPVAPVVPQVSPVEPPTPVEFTPEVRQARDEFFRAFEAEANRPRAEPETTSRKKRAADPAFAYTSTYSDSPFVQTRFTPTFYSAFPSYFRAATPVAQVQPTVYSAANPATPVATNFVQPFPYFSQPGFYFAPGFYPSFRPVATPTKTEK